MKTCNRCGVTYTNIEENFYKDKSTKSGYDHRCSKCNREVQRISYHNCKDKEANMDKLPKSSCSQCGEVYPLHKEFWGARSNTKTGFMPICRKCKNLNAKIYKKQKREDVLAREKMKLATEETNMAKMYAEIMSREEEFHGLDISEVKLIIGKEYSVKIPRREGSTKDHYFVGRLIQDCSTHVVLKSKQGFCESFLKVDLLLGHECKGVK